jgi:hypothetical protein
LASAGAKLTKQGYLIATLLVVGAPPQADYYEASLTKDELMLSILEAHYAHVIQRLLKAWGSPADFNALYDDLYFDTRPVHRSGWPEDVQAELQLLRKVHELAYETDTEVVEEEVDDDIKWV